MNYVKHKKHDLVYGVLDGNNFQQHKWVSENKTPKEDKARGDIGYFSHLPSKEVDPTDFITITDDDYATLYYKDSLRIN